MAGKSSPHKRVKRRKPTADEQTPPRFASPTVTTTGSLPTPGAEVPKGSEDLNDLQPPEPPKDADTASRPKSPLSPEMNEVADRSKPSELLKNNDSTPPVVEASILPPHLAHLNNSYSLATMSVISSSKIEQKVKTLLKHLERFSYGKIDAKPGLVILHAKAPVASKMISVIEIAKRTVKGGKLYQYSRLSGEVTESKAKKRSGDLEAEKPKEEDDSEEAFEKMLLPERPKVRAVPVLTVYLARVPIVELAAEFGLQTVH